MMLDFYSLLCTSTGDRGCCRTGRFTNEEEGYVSLAGPLTNFVVFLVFFGINAYASYNPILSPYLLRMGV